MEPVIVVLLVILGFLIIIGIIVAIFLLPGAGLPGPITGLVARYRSNFTIVGTWNPAARVTEYRWLLIGTSDGGIIRSGSTTQTTVTIDSPGSGDYGFSVEGLNNVGKGTNAVTTVTVPSTGTTVQSTSVCQPSANALQVTAVFTPTAASSTTMTISTNNGPSYSATTLTATGPSSDPNIQWTGTFSNLPSGYLVNGQIYNIRIQAITNKVAGTPYILRYTANSSNTCGSSGVPSAPTNVVVTTIVNSSGTNVDQATWNSSPGATSYSWTVTDPNTGVVQFSGVTSSTLTTFALLSGPEYNFNVRAINSAGASPVTTVLFSP